MKTKYFLPIIILILLLAGCQPPVTPKAQAPTPTPIIQATAEPLPTLTPVTPSPVTEPPTAVPTKEPTPAELTTEALIALVMATSPAENIFSSGSPDGNWQVDIIRYDCVQVDPINEVENAYEQLIITRLSDGTQTVSVEQFRYCGGLGGFGLNEFYWSSNSRYFYFSYAREGGPDGLPCYPPDGEFSRVDVETGLTERVPGNGTQFSAEGITIGWDGQEIVVWNLNEGEIGRVPFVAENFNLHGLQMSPAGDQFVYLLGDACSWDTSAHSIIILVTLADLTQTTLLDSPDIPYVYAQWENETLLRLGVVSGYGVDSDQYYDLTTNQIIELTPTEP